MASEYYKPTTPGVRHRTRSKQKLSKTKLIKKLRRINKNYAGRNNSGKITIRHRGGRQKRFLRLIDFKRDAFEIPAKVNTIEYDPNRSANIALLHYQNGDKRYIIAPDGLKIGQTVISSKENAEIEPGNTLPLNKIPVGTPIHNLELTPGKGGQIIRSAGAAAYIQDKEDRFVSIKLPSGEIRRFPAISMATIGQVSNPDHKNRKLGKAGRRRLMGWRPSVRGVAMHPGAHPHGGGEGRSGIGMKSPKSPWGNRTLGKKTRKVKKYSTKDIIKDRRSKNN
jgi:large subunit ribosomal protein L2